MPRPRLRRCSSLEFDRVFSEVNQVAPEQQLGVGGQCGTSGILQASTSASPKKIALKPEPSVRELNIFHTVLGQERNSYVYHVATVYGLVHNTHSSTDYMAMSAYSGGDLSDHYYTLRADLHSADPKVRYDAVCFVFKILRQALKALARCAEVNVIHRDIKNKNFLLNDELDLFLTDFGAAEHSGYDYGFNNAVNTDYILAGDPLPLTPKADVYVLGLIFYRLFFSKNPNPDKILSETRELNTMPSKLRLRWLLNFINCMLLPHTQRPDAATLRDYLTMNIQKFQFTNREHYINSLKQRRSATKASTLKASVNSNSLSVRTERLHDAIHSPSFLNRRTEAAATDQRAQTGNPNATPPTFDETGLFDMVLLPDDDEDV